MNKRKLRKIVKEEVRKHLQEVQPDKPDEVLEDSEVPRNVKNALGALGLRIQYVDRVVRQHFYGGNIIVVELDISTMDITPETMQEVKRMGLKRISITDRYDPVLYFDEQ